jgi:esterase/lipase superfamily enzyme
MLSLFCSLLAANFLVMSDRSQFWDADKISNQTKVIEAGKEANVNFAEFIGKRVLLLVHGFNNSSEDAMNTYNQINKNLSSFNLYDTVIGYLWPGYGNRLEYFSAEKNAKALADRMRLHLNLLSFFATEVDLLAHSMGNRLVLEALESDSHQQNRKLIDNFYSLAPAVDDDSIEQNHTYYHSTEQCKKIFVFHSACDDVLKILYVIAEENKALGSQGDGNPKLMPKNVQFVDCSDFVHGHSDYFTVPSLYAFIKNQQTHKIPSLPNVKLLADGLTSPINAAVLSKQE